MAKLGLNPGGSVGNGEKGRVSVMRTRFGVIVACMMNEKKLAVGSL